MRDADKESRAEPPRKSLRSRRSNTAQLTYTTNMARMVAQLASGEFQDASSPIMFHRFDDIPVPPAPPTTFNFKISQGSVLKILRELGLLDSGANGGISNGKDMRLMFSIWMVTVSMSPESTTTRSMTVD